MRIAPGTLGMFREIWLVDFEFRAEAGDRPEPICLVGHELRSDRVLRVWEDELLAMTKPPYSIDRETLFVAYYASAELSCHLALGWHLPERVLDLFVEFRNLRNGHPPPPAGGWSLLGALRSFGLSTIGADEKESMRQRAVRGGPWADGEPASMLDYCESDVLALKKLLPHMLPQIDFHRAVYRGRFMRAVAWMEHIGIPIDVEKYRTLMTHWSAITGGLIADIDRSFGVFDGQTFKAQRFVIWLAERGIVWPMLPSGRLALDEDTFRELAKIHPELAPLKELRTTLSKMRLTDLAVGRDGRNRTLLSPYRAKTSRNQPSTSRFIFGPACWLRSLIRPAPGFAIAYVDYSQQEFGIAAALSGDLAMMQAYSSGDPYLAFAKQAGAAPTDATRESHEEMRDQFKACSLGVQYCLGAAGLAYRIGEPIHRAVELLELHRRTYPTYWAWAQGAVDYAMTIGHLTTVFGWRVQAGPNANPRSFQNFPCQGNGAEMLRLACNLVTESGISVCAPVHDALLIEAPLEKIDQVVLRTQELMADASRVVLGGFELRSDAKTVRYPDRYTDKRGAAMWDAVWRQIGDRPTPPLVS